MKNPLALLFDCGATNVRVIAMDIHGNIEASQSYPNQTETDPHYEGGRIWNVDAIWEKLCKAAKIVTSQIDTSRIVGVATTTFGVDGTLVAESGELLYPVISWQCKRTDSIMENIGNYIPVKELYTTSGILPYSFNTINKLIWFKENHPELLQHPKVQFLYMPSLLNFRLTGNKLNDRTMSGTSMLTDLSQRNYSQKTFNALELQISLMGDTASAGTKVGSITSRASIETGIPENTPVFLAGHDTQFAIIGSGVGMNQPVLSSGTWEILMSRTQHYTVSEAEFGLGLTTELDAEEHTYNIGVNYLGSGVLEWIRRMFYMDIPQEDVYSVMISEAEKIPMECEGVRVNPDFLDKENGSEGAIIGITLQTTRAHIYRATLEALAHKLKKALQAVEKAGNFKAEYITCVGGGTKNKLWNQLRADICDLPIRLIKQKETTVLGSSMYVFKATGFFNSIEEAQSHLDYQPEIIYPSSRNV